MGLYGSPYDYVTYAALLATSRASLITSFQPSLCRLLPSLRRLLPSLPNVVNRWPAGGGQGLPPLISIKSNGHVLTAQCCQSQEQRVAVNQSMSFSDAGVAAGPSEEMTQ